MPIPALALAALLVSTTTAIQPSAHPPLPHQQLRDLEWGELNILHTTDNHGWHAGHLLEPQYSADLGDYASFITHLRALAEQRDVDLLVVDSGDRAEGNGLWDASEPKGRYTRELVGGVGYDLLTAGNHELYNGTTAEREWREMLPRFAGRYLASNVDVYVDGAWRPLGNRTVRFTTARRRLDVVAMGWLFDFVKGDTNVHVTAVEDAIAQPWFAAALAHPPDIFVILAHIDVDMPELLALHRAIRARHPHVPIQFLAGHAHQRKFKRFDPASHALESGRYCETVGFVSLSGLRRAHPPAVARRYIDFNRRSFMHHTSTNETSFDTPHGLALTHAITAIRDKLDLNRVIGCAPQTWYLTRAPYGAADNWYTYLSTTLLPTMVTNPARNATPRLIYINTGSQRFDVFRGPFTYDSSFLVSPFTSRFWYAADVPYPIASRLLNYFNTDVDPYRSLLAKGDLPIAPAEFPAPAELRAGHAPLQHPLTPPPRFTAIPGHVTRDDLGRSGDDTVHTPVPYYEMPKVIQANASLPADPAELAAVDVVFFDFIAENVEAGLNKIAEELGGEWGGRRWNGTEVFARYMGEEETMTRLVVEFVGRYWGGGCE